MDAVLLNVKCCGGGGGCLCGGVSSFISCLHINKYYMT